MLGIGQPLVGICEGFGYFPAFFREPSSEWFYRSCRSVQLPRRYFITRHHEGACFLPAYQAGKREGSPAVGYQPDLAGKPG